MPGAVVPGAACGAACALCRVLGAAGPGAECAPAIAQMPDPRPMHGQAIPAGELPAGSVTVRVVRQAWATTWLACRWSSTEPATVRHATTGAEGRAQYMSVPAGRSRARDAVVDSERLESTTFDVPGAGGVRTILVAGLGLDRRRPAARRRQPPRPRPARRVVVWQQHALCRRVPGRHHRGVLPARDRQQHGRARPPASPLVIDLPDEAVGAALLEEASPLAA